LIEKKYTIQLGQLVRDRITNYEGIATSYTDYLFGCRRIGVTQRVKDPSTMIKGDELGECMFDEGSLEVIGDGVYIPPKPIKDPGGPHDHKAYAHKPNFRSR
jgi:hypothetical protein